MALGKDVWRRAVITRAKSLRKVSPDCERMLFHMLYGSASSATGVVDADPELVAFTVRVSVDAARKLLAEADSAGLLVWSPESERAYLCGSFAADPPVSWFNWRGYRAELDKSPDCSARQAAREELGRWEDADAHGKGGQWVVDPRSTPARPPLDRGLTPDAGAGAGAGADAGARPPIPVATAPAASQAPQSNDAETATGESQTGLFANDPKPQPPRQMKRKREPFAPPSLDDARIAFAELGSPSFADGFCDFYASKGWFVGDRLMVDWKAAARRWHRDNSPGGRFYRPSGASSHDTRQDRPRTQWREL